MRCIKDGGVMRRLAMDDSRLCLLKFVALIQPIVPLSGLASLKPNIELLLCQSSLI